MSILEVGKTAQKELRFNIIQDSSLNTDFISFNDRVFNNTLAAFTGLFNYALSVKNIPSSRIYTVISSGVKVQAQKDNNNFWITKLIDSFRIKIKEPSRNVEVINAINEAKLSHLGIVPEERRYTTFLIDIGSGNTKGGYFPNGNTNNFRLFELTWGTKSTANATEKRLGDNNTMTNITHNLILTPILRLQIAQGATGEGKPMVDLLCELWLGSGHSTLKVEAEERGLSLTDLDRLAEQFHLASIQIRGIMEELNPGRQFELNQVAQFGVDRLEDGEVAQ